MFHFSLKEANGRSFDEFLWKSINKRLQDMQAEVPIPSSLTNNSYIVQVSWRDKITTKSIRESKGQEDMENIIGKRRLWWWLGHVLRKNNVRRANQILHWVPERRKRTGRQLKNWTETVKNDLRGLEISWERADGLAMDRVKWRRCDARCEDMHRLD